MLENVFYGMELHFYVPHTYLTHLTQKYKATNDLLSLKRSAILVNYDPKTTKFTPKTPSSVQFSAYLQFATTLNCYFKFHICECNISMYANR